MFKFQKAVDFSQTIEIWHFNHLNNFSETLLLWKWEWRDTVHDNWNDSHTQNIQRRQVYGLGMVMYIMTYIFWTINKKKPSNVCTNTILIEKLLSSSLALRRWTIALNQIYNETHKKKNWKPKWFNSFCNNHGVFHRNQYNCFVEVPALWLFKHTYSSDW